MSNKVSVITKGTLIAWGVTLALTAIILLIPEQGLYNLEMKKWLAVTVFCLSLAAFEAIPNMAVAALLMALYAVTRCAPINVVMGPWVGTTSIMLIGAFFLAATLQASGLLTRIAYHLLCLARGSYFILLFAIFMAGIVLNILTTGWAYLVMPPLCLGLVVSLNALNTRLSVGIGSACILGSCTSHAYTYQSSAWAVISGMVKDNPIVTDFPTPLSITLDNWPMFIVSLFMLWVISKWYKPEQPLEDVTYFREELQKLGKLTRVEKMNGVMLTVLLVYIFTSSFHGGDINYGFAVIPWMVYLPFINGADEKVFKFFKWDIIFFIMACMSIGVVATSLGVGDALSALTIDILGDRSNYFVIFAIVFVIVFALNFFMTPLAIFSLISVPIVDIVANYGFNPKPFLYAINACSEAILLPYEYVPYLIVFGFGMMSMMDFIKVNVFRSIVFFAGFLFVLVPYWMLIGML